MKKYVVLLALVLSGVVPAAAQLYLGGPLEVWVEHSDPDNAKLNVKQHERGIYTLIFDFHDVTNMEIPKLFSAIIRGDGTIMPLRPIDPQKPWDYNFSSKWTRGRINPANVDSTFVNLLPFDRSVSKKTFELRHPGTSDHIVNYNVIGFRMDRGDTIRAVRRGVVIDVIDQFPPDDPEEEAAAGEYNSLDVQHDDGTIARYAVLEKGSMTVRSGSMVYAGMPIALAGTINGDTYELRFHIYYQRDNLMDITSLDEHTITYYHIDPVFDTSAGKTRLGKGASYRSE